MEALAELRRAADSSPREDRYALAVASLLYQREKARPPAMRSWTELQSLVEHLAKVAHGAAALNFVAWYWAEQHQPERGLPFAHRAFDADPNPAVLDTLALLEFEDGDAPTAFELQRRAVSMLPEVRPSREMLARLAQYRAAAQQSGKLPQDED